MQSHRDPRQVIKKTRWQKQHANHRSSRDREVLGNATRGAAERHSPGPVRLTARWPLTLRGHTHRWEPGARSEQVQALEHTEASLWDHPARSLLNSARLRDQMIKHFLSTWLSSSGFSHWLYAHSALTWLLGSAESFLLEDGPKSKVNTVLSSCKFNNHVIK